MGLENGIVLEMKTKIKYQPWFCDLELDTDNTMRENGFYVYNVDYWCSGYDVRRMIFDTLHINPDDASGEYSLNSTDVLKIITILKEYILSGEGRDVEDRTFWSTIDNLYWVYEYMSKRPQDIIRCYFYDSW